MGMNSKTKKLFKRYRGYYRKGTLQKKFIENIHRIAWKNDEDPETVIQSWEAICRHEYGEIKQEELI